MAQHSTSSDLEYVAVKDLRLSQHNRRAEAERKAAAKKNAGRTPFGDLVESVRERGVLQPLVVVRSDDGDDVVCGGRRLEAAKQAGIELVPARVIPGPLEPAALRELVHVENTQREGLPPVAEAELLAELAKAGSVEEVGRRIGRSPGYVRLRLGLLNLHKSVRSALAEGRCSLDVALAIGRLPDPELQRKAFDDLDGYGSEGLFDAKGARETIARRFLLRLADAPFDRADEKLTKAGSCTRCPKRTGNQAELFADVESPDLCTDPRCWREKCDADFQARADAPDGPVLSVLKDAEARKVFGASNGYASATPIATSTFVSLDETVLRGNKKTTLRKLLGDVTPPVTLAQHPDTHAAVELVERADVAKLLPAEQREQVKRGAPDRGRAKQIAKEKRDAELRRRAVEAVAAWGQDKFRKLPPALALALRHVVAVLADRTWHEKQKALLARRGLLSTKRKGSGNAVERSGGSTLEERLGELVAKSTLPELGGLALELVAWNRSGSGQRPDDDRHWHDLLALCGVSEKTIAKALDAAVKESSKPKARAARKARKA